MEVLKLINRRLMTKVTSVHKDIKYVIFQNLKNEKCLVKYHMHLLKYMIKDILLYYYNYAFHQLPWQYVKIKLINPTYVPVTTQCFLFLSWIYIYDNYARRMSPCVFLAK